jgi:hypothetical protein
MKNHTLNNQCECKDCKLMIALNTPIRKLTEEQKKLLFENGFIRHPGSRM